MFDSFWSDSNNDTGTVFRDVILVIMLTFVILFLAALVHINPEAEKDDETSKPPGNVQVDISWRTGAKSDVDLWVKGPGDLTGVGYSNRAGELFNLLRDDLGQIGDPTNLNYENAYTHGLPDGEYTINLHYYNPHGEEPMDVRVVIRYADCRNCIVNEIFAGTVELKYKGQELTVMRFWIKDGQIDPTRTNNLFQSIRTVSPGDNYGAPF